MTVICLPTYKSSTRATCGVWKIWNRVDCGKLQHDDPGNWDLEEKVTVSSWNSEKKKIYKC